MSDRYARTRRDPGPATVAAFQVRGRFLTALALRIDTERADGPFYAQLDEQLHKSPQLFLGAPIVLDFVNAPSFADPNIIRDLVDNLRQRDLRVFGVQNAAGVGPSTLQSLGLIALPTGREAPLARDADPAPAADAVAPDAPPVVENKVIRSPIRSGQMVVAERGDLTIIGSVASGAELVAAGNIHVYGALRGRAMAGCHGNEDAHIFCQSLNAELVAIAGLYQTSETLEDAARQRCTHIYLDNEKLCMEVIA
ncbi:septum site-determining protein MinC [Falsirhodobacter sp. 20TX0035]|uniref:septum site-determining protein MinC n=1 Tax=Falsirhodobacter sp. 20TX0035 TaxID=3022019 RepID=UPI00232E824D|nr:septum site-determining protein MinC [Falsirhodobacter sp. 20TX0035]MDB6453254.1 septum site-determining protein MinC [Falsirhodobacter sp. 20TX0035]